MYDVLNAYLENGLKVVLHKIEGAKTVSCGLWVKQGAVYETDENNGLSHLTEHLLLNAEDVINERYADLLSKASAEGVIYNAATTKEYTCYYFTGLSSTLPTCLDSLACIAQENRKFHSEAFENEKKVVLQEATSFYSSFQQIKERTSQAIWGNSGTGKIIMGNMQNIANASIQEIQKIVENSYVPENSMIFIVGNIDYTKTLHLVEEYFSQWKDRPSYMEEGMVESTPGIYSNEGNGASAVFSVGFRGPAYQAKNRAATEMMVRMLGQSGMQSRMIQEVRIKRGLAYTTGGFSSFYKERGTLGFMAVCDRQKVHECAKVIMDVLVQAKEKGFTEEEIQREKNAMETSLLLSVDNITEHLRYIGKCSIMNYNFYIENAIREIRNIRQEDVNRVAKDILAEHNMGLAVIGTDNIEKLLDIVAI
ncbi:MAG: M16 family metallopeptidase [Roseburia sp.]